MKNASSALWIASAPDHRPARVTARVHAAQILVQADVLILGLVRVRAPGQILGLVRVPARVQIRVQLRVQVRVQIRVRRHVPARVQIPVQARGRHPSAATERRAVT